MITETYVSELRQNIPINGMVAFLGKTNNKDKKLHLMTPEHKLKFNLKKDAYKNKKELQLVNVHTKASFSTLRDNVLNFGILCTKGNLTIDDKEQFCMK